MWMRYCQVAWSIVVVLGFASPAASAAADPPALMEYQGVLRNSSNAPLTGAYDMTFRFFDAETGGDEVLVDRHLAANSQAVAVAGGLFAVGLGSGQVVDGSGPGLCLSLTDLFRDHDAVWLEVQVAAERLAPRTRVLASGYALNAATAQSSATLEGLPASHFLDTSSSWQWKSGALVLQNAEAGHAAIDAVQANGSTDTAGYFSNPAYTGKAWIAEGDRGLRASGNEYGGSFEAPYWGSKAVLARDNTGAWVQAGYGQGACAGRFYGAFDGASHVGALGCNGGAGVDGYGNPGGHFLSNWGYTGEAYLGYLNDGVDGLGTWTGGYFADTDSSAWVNVAYSTYKLAGSGAVSFIQNHPYDKDKVIVYAAPEGDEVAVYTRGTARLHGGEARVRLGETFPLVANPDIGLSAHVTPLGEPVPLAVAGKSTSELIVRGPAGSNAEFDYIVWGLRIGFESQSIVQPKHREARVPSMADHEAAYKAEPSLRAYNALERFKGMRAGRPWNETADLARSRQLLEAVGTYDPGRDGSVQSLLGLESHSGSSPGEPASPVSPVSGQASPGGPATAEPGRAGPGPVEPPAESGHEAIESRPWIVRLPASDRIEPGDVVVFDPVVAGAVKPCDRSADAALVGVAVGSDAGGSVDLAVATILEVRVDAGFGAVRPGDLLTSSETPGAARRAAAADPGTVLGKALEGLEAGIGTIRVLVMVR